MTLLRLGIGGGAVAAAVIAITVGIGQVGGGVKACAAVLSAAGSAGSVSGIATHYVLQSGGGNCSYPGPPADQLYVALSPSEYDSAAPCGSYLQVSGPDGSVRVEVVDQCPECATGHIDLSATAFAKIAPLSAGLINVSYQTIADPSLPGPVSFEVKNGSSRYWLSLLVMNTGNATASVQVETAPGNWLNLARTNYNAWIAQSGAGPGPFTIRVTDTLGHQVTAGGITLEPGAVQDTGAWMYGGGTVAPPPPAASPTPAAPVTSSPPTSPGATSSPATSARASASSPATPRRTPASAKPTPTVVHSLTAEVPSLPPATQTLIPRTSATTGAC